MIRQSLSSSAPTATRLSSVEAYSIIRDLAYGCKVLFLAGIFWALVWIFFFGQPAKLLGVPLGVYQAFHCGLTAEVVDPWTCDN